jgi:hypothetical protein
VFLDAIEEAGATPPEDLPIGPDVFRYSVDEAFDGLLRDHGLEERTVTTLRFTHPVAGADQLWQGFLAGSLRIAVLILRQPDETRRRIRDCFDRLLRDYQDGDRLRLPVSAKLASGRKPAG